jgi:hypothetical protein
MSSFRPALLLIAAVATSYGAEPLVEIARWPDLVAQAKDFGVDYPAAVARAERGDTKSLHTVFSVTSHVDGSGATSHAAVLRRLLERLGDRKFGGVLRAEPRNLRDRVIQQIDFDFARPWKKAFPLTYALGSHDTSLLRGHQDI